MSDSPRNIVLPARFEDVDLDDLVVLIADMLQRLISHNNKIPLSPESLTRFHSRSPPSISVLDYLRRIVKYTNVERTCLLITLHYIDQICERLTHFTISSLTVHRFIVASVAVSSKALCDVFCTNTHYAKVGGIRTEELNILEREFLHAIDWRLTCTPELLQEYYTNLAQTHSSRRYHIADPHPCPSSPCPSSPHLHSPSRSPSPPDTTTVAEPSSVLMGRVSAGTSPVIYAAGPTLEQNMAFAALQEQQQQVHQHQQHTTGNGNSHGFVPRAEKRAGSSEPDTIDIRAVKRELE